jgi:hypothetical protein
MIDFYHAREVRAVTNEHGIWFAVAHLSKTAKDGAASSRNGPGKQQNQKVGQPPIKQIKGGPAPHAVLSGPLFFNLPIY